MLHKIIYSLKWFLLIALVLISGGYLYALGTQSTGFKTSTSDQTVDFYDACTTVKHTGSVAYFVPTKTLSEWNSFKSKKPGNVILSLGSRTLTPGLYTDGFNSEIGYSTSRSIGSFGCPNLLNGFTINVFLHYSPQINGYFLGAPNAPNSNASFNNIVIKNTSGSTLITLTRTSANYGCSSGTGCWTWPNKIPNVFSDGEDVIIEIN